MKLSLNNLITIVQRRADTEGTKINAAEVSRVVSLTLYEIKERLIPAAGTLGATRLDEVSAVLDLVRQGHENRL